MMRDNQRVEVARISEAVARDFLTRSNVLASVEREIHGRLPETIHRHAQALMPEMAKAAVAGATPDLSKTQAKIEESIREAVLSDLPELVDRAAAQRLPELAEGAIREAAPETGKIRAELVEGASGELTELLRTGTENALTEVVLQATERVQQSLRGAVEQEAARLIPELARTAVANAAPDRDEVRAELVTEAGTALSANVRAAVAEAAPGAVAEVALGIRDSLTESVRAAAMELLPALAADAVTTATPDPATMRDELIGLATATVGDTARTATEARVPELVQAVSEQALAGVRDAVRREAESAFAKYAPNVVNVVLPDREAQLDQDTHASLRQLLLTLHARCHVLLAGPAGAGKSTLAKDAAAALGLGFQALSVGAATSVGAVFGDPDGPFRRVFEHGGLLLLDDVDNANPNLLTELNQALSLGVCSFPDRMVDAHPDFRLVATANRTAVDGAQPINAATLDRFVVLDVPVDRGLEERIALRHAPDHPIAVHDLLTKIRQLRAIAVEKKLPVVFSPRASIDGAKLLQAGATVEQVLRWRVLRGLSAEHRTALGLD